MFELIFIIFISIYTLQTIVFIVGSKRKFEKVDYADLPSISILVAARNEEDNIIDCLESLAKLEYPDEKIEIIIIDDNSTDKTNQLAGQFIKDKEQFLLIKPSQEIGSLKGKTNALANAIRIASGRVILTTDADCIVSPMWAIELASYYKKDVAMVCGYTDQFSDTNFGGMQSVDFIYLLMIAGGVMNFGKPLSCIGNNMSFRKSVYREVGGYEVLPFSVTEDFNLLMAMHRIKKYRIIYPLSSKGMVTSKPCPNFKVLMKQKKRWGVGGLKSDIVGYSVMATGFVTHLMMLLTPFFFTPLSLYLSLFKIGVDYFALKGVHEKLNLKLNFKHFLLWEIYFIFYVIALPFMTLPSQRVEWKGRVYN